MHGTINTDNIDGDVELWEHEFRGAYTGEHEQRGKLKLFHSRGFRKTGGVKGIVVRISLKFYRPSEREGFVIKLDERYPVSGGETRLENSIPPSFRRSHFLAATWPDNGARVTSIAPFSIHAPDSPAEPLSSKPRYASCTPRASSSYP